MTIWTRICYSNIFSSILYSNCCIPSCAEDDEEDDEDGAVEAVVDVPQSRSLHLKFFTAWSDWCENWGALATLIKLTVARAAVRMTKRATACRIEACWTWKKYRMRASWLTRMKRRMVTRTRMADLPGGCICGKATQARCSQTGAD